MRFKKLNLKIAIFGKTALQNFDYFFYNMKLYTSANACP